MRIEFDSENHTIEVNGVKMTFDILEMMTNPDPRRPLRFTRIGSRVIVQATITDEDQRLFDRVMERLP